MRVLIVLADNEWPPALPPHAAEALVATAAAYCAFQDAGVEMVFCSPSGGAPFLGARWGEEGQGAVVQRVREDPRARQALSDTLCLNQVDERDFTGIFYPGGIGAMRGLCGSPRAVALAMAFVDAGRPSGFVAHGLAVLCGAGAPEGEPALRGRTVTASTVSEDEAAYLPRQLPFLLWHALRRQGADLTAAPDGACHVMRDGALVTGQNAASAGEAARQILRLML